MKKTTALLVCALLALLPALAEAPLNDPFDLFQYDLPEVSEPRSDTVFDESLTLNFHNEEVRLGFDPTPQYSSIQGGMVQASYYAYGADGVTMYELYIIFPETAKPGMVITPEYEALTNGEASISLIVSDGSQEQYYFSSLTDGAVYPAESGFSISIDSIDGSTYSGSFSATLVALDMSSGGVADTLIIPDTPFRFTLGGGGQGSFATSKPTVSPDDMKKV